MDYKTACKVSELGQLMMKEKNYEVTTILGITNDSENRIVYFRCTDGIFPHTSVVLPMSVQALTQLFLRSPKTTVFINHNDESGEELYSVQVVDSDGFWLDSFKTQQEAEQYIKDHGLKKVESKTA